MLKGKLQKFCNNKHPINSMRVQSPKLYNKVVQLKKKGFSTDLECLYACLSDLKSIPICTWCKENKLKFISMKRGYTKSCSYKCAKGRDETQETRKQTCLDRYGVENASSLEEFKKKAQKTNLKRYGVRHTFQSPEIKEKCRRTMKKRYGVEYGSQNSDIHYKQQTSRHRRKIIKRQGKKFKLQGYEPLAVDYFIDKGVPASKILHKNVPSFKYELGGKQHTYHPDLKVKIKGKWWIIEVKSDFTIGIGNKDKWLVNKTKMKAVMDAGYNFAFMIFLKDGVKILKNPTRLTYKNIIKLLS